MRLLVACESCRRQYDASKLGEGARFHCLCGATLDARRPTAHDAEVVRCSSCGAPRQDKSSACGFCGADFTLHERDLHTICPACLARVSDRAKFCHHCAEPLMPSGEAGDPTDYACPACGDHRSLSSRVLGDVAIAVLECPRCAGLWLSGRELELVLDRTRKQALASEALETLAAQGQRPEISTATSQPLYRPCPICGKLMHRRNFGRKSGIIVDTCRAHGCWFDARELDAILRWMRGGGEQAVKQLEREEQGQAERDRRLDRHRQPQEAEWPARYRGSETLLDLLSWLAGRLVGR